MTVEVSREQLDEWSNSPIVEEALGRLGDDYSARDLMLSVHDVMTGLEDRFPGLTFDQVFNADTLPSQECAVRTARACGASDADLALIFDITSPRADDEIGVAEFELCRAGYSIEDLVNEFGFTKTAAGDIHRLDVPLSEGQERIVAYMDEHPLASYGEIARELAVSRNTVRLAARKQRYRRWIGEST